MDGAIIEPRKQMWALAEVSWADASGTANHASATIEDMSASGACLRVKAPIQLGSRLMVKWHREQFAAIARNCRSDGAEFLLGVRRDKDKESPSTSKSTLESSSPPRKLHSESRNVDVDQAVSSVATRAAPERSDPASRSHSFAPAERNIMQPKHLMPNFWRRQQDGGASQKTLEVAMGPKESPAETASPARNELLSYEDIYHAAGIMTPPSGYGVHKVVEMLNSERIRDLSKDVKRASVLMALDAAGASVEEMLRDARERQRALDAYEERQRKQLEEFEARKTQESAHIQAEMERLTAHYAERIQRNREQVAREKELLHTWQMAKQGESLRISEVLEVCAERPTSHAVAAAQSPEGPRNANPRPTLLPDASARS